MTAYDKEGWVIDDLALVIEILTVPPHEGHRRSILTTSLGDTISLKPPRLNRTWRPSVAQGQEQEAILVCRARMMIDEAAAELHELGYSIGDVLARSADGPVWMVHAHHGKRHVVAKAPTQTDAWHEAVLQVRRLALDE